METLITFNGVRILLTTGQQMSEVQNCVEHADVIISVYPRDVRILQLKKGTASIVIEGENS